MRSVVPFSNWWNVGSCASVAEYSSTGIDTRTNEITPDQIARAMFTPYPPHRRTSPAARRVVTGRPPALPGGQQWTVGRPASHRGQCDAGRICPGASWGGTNGLTGQIPAGAKSVPDGPSRRWMNVSRACKSPRLVRQPQPEDSGRRFDSPDPNQSAQIEGVREAQSLLRVRATALLCAGGSPGRPRQALPWSGLRRTGLGLRPAG